MKRHFSHAETLILKHGASSSEEKSNSIHLEPNKEAVVSHSDAASIDKACCGLIEGHDLSC